LGGGVGCISSTLAKKPEVQKIYCVEMVESAVTLCQPIVKNQILGKNANKVVSVVGDFDQLELEVNSSSSGVCLIVSSDAIACCFAKRFELNDDFRV